jgi:hypothetical protein
VPHSILVAESGLLYLESIAAASRTRLFLKLTNPSQTAHVLQASQVYFATTRGDTSSPRGHHNSWSYQTLPLFSGPGREGPQSPSLALNSVTARRFGNHFHRDKWRNQQLRALGTMTPTSSPISPRTSWEYTGIVSTATQESQQQPQLLVHGTKYELSYSSTFVASPSFRAESDILSPTLRHASLPTPSLSHEFSAAAPTSESSPMLTPVFLPTPISIVPRALTVFSCDLHTGLIEDLKDIWGRIPGLNITWVDESQAVTCSFFGTCATSEFQRADLLHWIFRESVTDAMLEWFRAYITARFGSLPPDVMVCAHPVNLCRLFIPWADNGTRVVAYQAVYLEFTNNRHTLQPFLRDYLHLARNPSHAVLANNLYSQEETKWLTGFRPTYLPSLCRYTRALMY